MAEEKKENPKPKAKEYVVQHDAVGPVHNQHRKDAVVTADLLFPGEKPEDVEPKIARLIDLGAVAEKV